MTFESKPLPTRENDMRGLSHLFVFICWRDMEKGQVKQTLKLQGVELIE